MNQELASSTTTNNSTQSMDAMQHLKTVTQPYHRALEQQVNLPALSTSLASYRHLLQRFYGFYLPGELQLARLPWSTVDFDWSARRHTLPLANDLQWLGETPATLAALPRCATLPALYTIPQALGYLYVVEGSTLGGQLISRQLQQQWPALQEAGCQFFQRYGTQVGMMWRSFSHFVNHYVAMHPTAEAALVDTACATFQQLRVWLQDGASTTLSLDTLPQRITQE